MRSNATLPTKKFAAPTALPGIDFSDHLNYHQKTDTLATLDLPKMAKVIDGVFKTLIAL